MLTVKVMGMVLQRYISLLMSLWSSKYRLPQHVMVFFSVHMRVLFREHIIIVVFHVAVMEYVSFYVYSNLLLTDL